MSPSEFESSPLSADEALERASELELQATPRAHGFVKRSFCVRRRHTGPWPRSSKSRATAAPPDPHTAGTQYRATR